MPLSLWKPGETVFIKSVRGGGAVKQRLETLGFTAGSSVTVVSRLADDLIVSVKDSRIALSRELAQAIFV
jgi:ferrous iron transport protein A